MIYQIRIPYNACGNRFLCPASSISESVGLGWGPITWVSCKFPAGAAADQETTVY